MRLDQIITVTRISIRMERYGKVVLYEIKIVKMIKVIDKVCVRNEQEQWRMMTANDKANDSVHELYYEYRWKKGSRNHNKTKA